MRKLNRLNGFLSLVFIAHRAKKESPTAKTTKYYEKNKISILEFHFIDAENSNFTEMAQL
jgi:hypothetical protein